MDCIMCLYRPWPRASSQAQRLVALGRAALAYGQVNAAQELWQLAGNWADLLPLTALQADFGTLRRLAATVSLACSASALGRQSLAVLTQQ